MGYQKYRIRRKNSSGTYDILHVESQSSLILRYTDAGVENGNVESALRALETKVATLDGSGAGGIGSKADKVSNATDGHFAGLDSDGNLTDSGKKASDFAAASHNHAIGNINGGTANRVAIYGTGGVLAVSPITTTKLGYLTDVTSNIQAQLNGKAASDHNHNGVYAPADHNHDTVYEKKANRGVAGGYAPLESDGKIASSYLPSYVDDVIEGYLSGGKFYKESAHTTVITGESGKIYVDLSTEKTYRWSGSAFVEISASLALGTTASTAFAGDKGQTAYEHSQSTHARTDATKTAKSSTNGNVLINNVETVVYTHPSYTNRASGLYKITVDALGHVSAATAVTGSDITGLTGVVAVSFDAFQPTTQKTNDLWFESIS